MSDAAPSLGLEAVNLPVAYTGIIWSVDRVLDMCRTTVDVASDATVALIVAHKEGELAGGEMDGAAGVPETS